MGRAGVAAAARAASLPAEVAAALLDLPRGMRAPEFWQRDGGIAPRLLAPAAAVVAAVTARRVARPGWRAPVPVICCGNATVGRRGQDHARARPRRPAARDGGVAFLTRGHGGRARGVHRVDPSRDGAALVGDEALLLAAVRADLGRRRPRRRRARGGRGGGAACW